MCNEAFYKKKKKNVYRPVARARSRKRCGDCLRVIVRQRGRLFRRWSTIFQRGALSRLGERRHGSLSLAHARLCRFVLTRSGVSLNACIQRVFSIRVHQAEFHSRAASPPSPPSPPRRREPGPDVGRHGDSISQATFSIARRSTRVNRPSELRYSRWTRDRGISREERKRMRGRE